MVDVFLDADCGNAPKKAAIKDWLVSLASGETDSVDSQLADDVRWEVAGSRTVEGMTDISTIVEDLTALPVSRLTISNILSHGKQVAADGSLKLHDGREVRFAHFFTFSSNSRAAKISEIATFTIYKAG